LRQDQRVIVYPAFLNKLGLVLATGNIGMDPEDSRQQAYESILEQSAFWPEASRPVMLPEDSEALTRWPVLAANVFSWMEDPKRIVVAGRRQVLEGGPDVCNSETDAEYSDHGEMWTDADMYTPDMIGPDSKVRTARLS
jgi:hypothetical protein